ncbi:O-antigen ligase family protein [Microlunatus elymi]|uniref:O-antigen ligase family protein n=1 Tax=Microlunatus elymi TaxID=2596828 RepID=A0A516PTS3_9ACTN|nr:O-antigen ligase family protein [Microlunatus elymi]QDP94596.1 O-antigen ligase family protein [Microlunatus elymi]
MTTRQVALALRRRWYVVLFGLLCSVAGVIGLDGPHRLYTVQTEFVFVGPGNPAITGLPDARAETLTDFAGVVGRKYEASHPTIELTSPTATLFGNGIRQGVSVQLANAGSQWVHSYNRPVLIVQIIGDDPVEVQQTLGQVSTALTAITRQLQTEAGAAPSTYITVFNDTQHSLIGSFGNSRMSRMKAAGIIAGLGVGASIALAVAADEFIGRRRSQTIVRAATGPTPGRSDGRGGTGFDAVTFLTIYLVLACALPSYLVIPALGQIGRPSILWGLAGVVWWVYFRLQRTTPLATGARSVHLALWAFLAVALAGLARAYLLGLPTTQTGPADAGLLRLLSWAGVALVALDGIPSLDRLLTLLRRIALLGGLMAILGLLQFATGRSFVDALTLPGFAVSSDFDSIQGRAGFVRAAGTASHPLEYASVLCIALPIGIVLGATDRRRGVLLRWWPPLVISLAVLISVSRSAIVGTVAGVVLLLPAIPPRLRVKAVGVVFTLLGLVFFLVPGMIGTLRGLFLGINGDPSTQSRTDSVAGAVAIAGRAPLIGSGFGTFLPQELILDNEYLGLVIEVGFIGCGLFIIALIAAAWSAWRSGRGAAREPWVQLGPAVAAALVSGSTTMIFFDGLSFPMSAALLFVLLGIAGALSRLLAGDQRVSASQDALVARVRWPARSVETATPKSSSMTPAS